MKNYNTYIKEILNLDIQERSIYRTAEGHEFYNKSEVPHGYLDNVIQETYISNYDSQSKYTVLLSGLQLEAITDILLLSSDQKQGIVKRAKDTGRQIEQFSEFAKQYSSSLVGKKTHSSRLVEFHYQFQKTFNVFSFQSNSASPKFYADLHNMLRIKLDSLWNFVNAINATIPPKFHQNADNDFSELQLIDHNEWALGYIKGQFDEQLELQLVMPENTEIGKFYTREDMVTVRTLHRFYIHSYLPVFDFRKFKNAVRELLISNTTNKEELKTILTRCRDIAGRNIEQYNGSLALLERMPDNDEPNSEIPEELKKYPVRKDTKRITIELDRSVWLSTRDEDAGYRMFDTKPYLPYSNRDLAVFSANVYNYLQAEVFKENGNVNANKAVAGKKVYAFFEELFYRHEDIPRAINALREVKNPIITEDNVYRLGQKNKGALVAWLSILEEKGIIIQDVGRETKATLLSQYLKGFTITGRAIETSIGSSAYKRYRKPLETLLS